MSGPPAGTAGPVFLAGLDRSGIGLLGDVLDRHPAFALSRRTNFWSFYDGRFGDLAETSNVDACLTELFRFRRIRDLGLDTDRIREAFLASSDRSYTRLFSLIGEHHASARGKPRWGDKSLGSERHAERILDAYPDGRMVHVIRDPRDRHASVTNHRGAKRGGVASTSAEWLDSVRAADRHSIRYVGRYLVIRYEDLAAAPREVLGEVCEFLGEAFDESSLDPQGDDENGALAFHARSVGRFRTDLRPRQVELIERVTAGDLERRGYTLSRPALGTGARVVLELVDLPASRILMPVRRSGLLGRRQARPAARRLVD
ncbi:MAG TPA: sulfotransferase [Acidimicrobiia bacterium]|nr:sulfotransferase [Acidimicrobiia bacterium]